MHRKSIEKLHREIAGLIVKAGECHEWIGKYKQKVPMHRWDGELRSVRRLLADAPANRFLTTSCKNRRCVNPDHFVQAHPLSDLGPLSVPKNETSIRGTIQRAYADQGPFAGLGAR